MQLPSARARIRGVAGEAARASAVARHAVRRTGVLAVATAKVALWLTVVVASLVVIASLGSSRHPRYPDPDHQSTSLRAHQRAGQFDVTRLDIAQQHRDAEAVRLRIEAARRAAASR